MRSKVITSFLQKLGSDLVEQGVITQSQLDQARTETEDTGENMGEALVRLGFADYKLVNKFIGDGLNIPTLELEDYEIDPATAALIDEDTARGHSMIPLFEIEDVITIAMVDPFDIFAIDKIRDITNKIVEPVLASEKDIRDKIDSFWGEHNKLDELMDDLTERSAHDAVNHTFDEEASEGIQTDDRPVIKLVDSIFSDAIERGSSDIHLEPEEGKLKVRYRVDGVLHDISSFGAEYQAAVIARIKYMADMDIGKRRVPQDGKIHRVIDGKKFDFRVSTYPVVYGEKLVMRILDLSSVRVDLGELGLDPDLLGRYRQITQGNNGIILVTGPTGSGKTTTLYATLNEIRAEHLNITTIEDPVEYEMRGVNQGQVDVKGGVTFASALRAIVRQDPDVILVGEIRDGETSELSVRAALTGHLVFSTLHTNSASGAISRLTDMGIEPFLIASTVRGVLAQRLVRLICPDCRKEYKPEPREYELLDVETSSSPVFFRGEGCQACGGTGFRKRIGIYELLTVSSDIRGLILEKAPDSVIEEAAVRSGMKTMKMDGASKVLQGLTTVDEVMRVI
ncbi:MAG: Flp pilus assembly complex ATPase component TadA [Candidatus Krumholzibacteriota bacterium]|nr:Flp pilus assembly complex ATPase component TadA [Candidatus Krumholzibacteriota bacterium]